MRVHELRLAADPKSGLAFHPRLSVVFGLGDAARNLLSEEYELMASGGTPRLEIFALALRSRPLRQVPSLAPCFAAPSRCTPRLLIRLRHKPTPAPGPFQAP